MSYIGNEPIVSATRTITEVTATAGQTVFTANGGYTVGYIDVFLNGAQLQTVDFTATNGTTVTLTEAAQVGDVIRLVAWGTFSTATHVPLTGDSNITGNINVSGNLGVGTTSPTAQLQINRSGTSDYTSFRLSNSGASGRTYEIGLGGNTAATGYANTLYFYDSNAGAIRMGIDASGRVTTPNQPAVWLTNQSDVTSTGLFTNWTVQQNIGSHYSGGTFTCPVAGTYFIYLALWRNSGTCDIAIRKNGTNEARVRNATLNDARDSQTVVFNCAANDTIDFTVLTVGNILGGTGYSKTLTSAVITLLG
jgi:hypothetical protein